MSWMTLLRVGMEAVAGGTSAADPQLQFFENFPGHLGAGFGVSSNNTLAIHAVNIPLSVSFNQVNVLYTVGLGVQAQDLTISFGLYSLNGSTFSLANSASGAYTNTKNTSFASWYSMGTSATQNISPGAWYFAFNQSAGATNAYSLLLNSSINPANAIPGGFLMGRMTASTTAMPGSIATSDLDITGSDAIRQPFIIITA